MTTTEQLTNLSRLVRYDILTSTTTAGSGHPTSSMSATELMVTLFFGGFLHYDLENPRYELNDRVIFSKGHASPLLYSLYQVAGVVSREELLSLRKFTSVLEGHPTPRFNYIDVATGSLGQGLSVGLGMALGIKKHIKHLADRVKREPRVWVLLGDSESAEGQVWEAAELASQYKANNLVGILDVNRLGQRGETMLGWDVQTYADRIHAFGWESIIVDDGHDIDQVYAAFEKAVTSTQKPVMIIAKTKKGKGVALLENTDNWHGKPLPQDKLEAALHELGDVDLNLKGDIQKPEKIVIHPSQISTQFPSPTYDKSKKVATREAYGEALINVCNVNINTVVLDGETSNSTFAETVKKTTPEAFYEMYIAEQNMVSVAVGFSKVGFIPYVSSFAAFFSRAFDQIRMAQYSEADIRIVGSHAGVSIGTDGSSQMALEDISMMRSILNSVVLYPSDAVSAVKLVEQLASQKGISYVRTTREKTPILYDNSEEFPIGGSKILRQSENDKAVIFTAGITLHEALKAYDELKNKGINVAVVDLYSVKPLDIQTIQNMASQTKHVVVVEDHYPAGGMGEAVKSLLHDDVDFTHLAVRKIPRSGTPEELLKYEEIDAEAIIKAITSL
jgi:transketolase